MYRFHYGFIKPLFQKRARLLFTDTDSLMYEIDGGYKKVYEEFKSNESKTGPLFDFSTLPPNHFCFTNQNKSVVGKFKDESSGDPILEFVGLRPKMYSFTTLSGESVKEKHRAKGIQYAAARGLTHAQYIEQLTTPTENRLTNRRIGSNLHIIYTFATSKRALCAFDDKRYLCHDGIHTLAFGHYNLPHFAQVQVDDEHPMDADAVDLIESKQEEELSGAATTGNRSIQPSNEQQILSPAEAEVLARYQLPGELAERVENLPTVPFFFPTAEKDFDFSSLFSL